MGAKCRKVTETKDRGEIEIWRDSKQTRSFLFIDDCLEAVRRLMDSRDFHGPINTGSEEMVTINRLVKMTMDIGCKNLTIKHIPGLSGVRGRNSDNKLIKEKLGWCPSRSLKEGLTNLYNWIKEQIQQETDKIKSNLTKN
jgi:nucleoside-diphosphate-sugar epimerase